VLNDDRIAPGRGFGMHPHDNMEIITIPLRGELAHRDNMGNASVVSAGEIQVMSAGTGVFHSEHNSSEEEETELLQIWVLPNQKGVTPRYDQIRLSDETPRNELHQIVSPDSSGPGMWIHQDAWFSLGEFDEGHGALYALHSGDSGVYVFCLDGEFEVAGHQLGPRDGMGVSEVSEIELTARTSGRILLMEVPMSR
jgi:quercetin 2,3-dioxygenase